MNNFLPNNDVLNNNLKENYFIDAIFAIANDFDHVNANASANYSKYPEMINIIGKNSFERSPQIMKSVEKEMFNLFLKENEQYFNNSTKIQEKLLDYSNFQTQNRITKNNITKEKLDENSIEQFEKEKEEQNEIYQFYNEIDGFPHHKRENSNNPQYPFEFLTKPDFRQFKDTHFFTVFS